MDASTIWPNDSEELTLFRVKTPKTKPRNWGWLWAVAVKACDEKGVSKKGMTARADSPVWSILGTKFPDSTGSSRPAFFWNSGMGVKDKNGKVYYQARDVKKNKQEEQQDEGEISADDVVENIQCKLEKSIPTGFQIFIKL